MCDYKIECVVLDHWFTLPNSENLYETRKIMTFILDKNFPRYKKLFIIRFLQLI